jgi:hypothetical protein
MDWYMMCVRHKGTHENLLHQSGLYKRLYIAQFALEE